MITVSIVLHKTPHYQIKKAFESLGQTNVDKIYLVDNSPTDALRSEVAAYDRVVYEHVENRGYGAGHNIAIRKAIDAGSRYHLVMNADVWWTGDVITPMKDYMDKNAEVGLVSPHTIYPGGALQYNCRMLPTPYDLFLKRFLPGEFTEKRMDKYMLRDFDHSKAFNCPYHLGAFMFFRVEALKDAGLFDERYFMYPEDIDLTRRVHERWKTMYWPGVTIVHEHQQASARDPKMFRIHLVNLIKYFNKWGWVRDKKRKEFNRRLRER